MKSYISTFKLLGLSLKSAFSICNSFLFIALLITFFLINSLSLFAKDVNHHSIIAPKNLKDNRLSDIRTSPLTGPESIRTNLYLLNANNTTILADGVLTEYNNLYHDSVYLEDAYKFTNINENLGLARYGSVLAVERRPIITNNDTLYFKLWKTTRRNYQLEFITINLNHPGMQAFLEDAYLGTSTSLTLTGTTKVNFSVNANAASANVNRFRIIYKATSAFSTLPVTFTSVRGSQLNTKISVDWKVENEINIEKYEVERSANGTTFSSIYSIARKGVNTPYNRYSWIDDSPLSGNNFYRIKSVDLDGANKFSLVIKVATGKAGNGTITIYPNPIKGNMVNLQFTNQPPGIYQVRLINNNGQVMYSGKLPVNNANISQTLFTNKNLAAGIYQLEIKTPDNTVNIQKAIVQE